MTSESRTDLGKVEALEALGIGPLRGVRFQREHAENGAVLHDSGKVEALEAPIRENDDGGYEKQKDALPALPVGDKSRNHKRLRWNHYLKKQPIPCASSASILHKAGEIHGRVLYG